MYGNGAGIGMMAVITAARLEVTREGLLQAPPAWRAAVAVQATPAARGALIAAPTRLTAAPRLTAAAASASVACVLELTGINEYLPLTRI